MTNIPKNTISYQKVKKSAANAVLLDTLAHCAPVNKGKTSSHSCNCSKKTKKEKNAILSKRAIAKAQTEDIILPLIQLDSELKESYWNTYHCARVLLEINGKIVTTYCKNRWCIVCNRIRTAKLINGYKPVVDKWKEPQFVTLTVPNIKGTELKGTIKAMQKQFYLILKHSREKLGIKLKGIRKLEVTWNKTTGEYHPHYHILIDGKTNARQLVEYWLERNPKAEKWCQDIKSANQNSMVEMFKYFTKLYIKEADGVTLPYSPEAMNHIFKTLYNKRIVQSFGSIKMVSDEFTDQELESSLSSENTNENTDREILWFWNKEEKNWIDMTTGELLVDIEPPPKIPPPYPTVSKN